MSLYNLIHGTPSDGKFTILTTIAGLKGISIPRFRDIYLNDNNQVIILTRTGGGNRQDYEEENDALTRFDTYVEDYDCDWDCTYAEFVYKIKDEYIDEIQKIIENTD